MCSSGSIDLIILKILLADIFNSFQDKNNDEKVCVFSAGGVFEVYFGK